VVLLFRNVYQVVALEILNIIVLELVQLIVELLVVLKPQLHHGRSVRTLLVKLSPPGWLLHLLHSDVVLANGLLLPFQGGRIHLGPEGEGDLELKVVVLLLAEGLKENGVVLYLYRLVLKGRTAGNVVPVSILDLNLDHMEVLGPLERGAHQDGLALLCLESCQSRVVIGPH